MARSDFVDTTQNSPDKINDNSETVSPLPKFIDTNSFKDDQKEAQKKNHPEMPDFESTHEMVEWKLKKWD